MAGLRHLKQAFKHAAMFLVAGAVLVGVLLAFAAAIRPARQTDVPKYLTAELEAATKARDTSFDPAKPVVLHVEADYSDQSAPWRPKGEAPVLHQLVQEGKLPPLADRVGPEPIVMRGVEGIGRYGGTWLGLSSTPNDAILMMGGRMAGASLLRWSPLGYPVVPHLARTVEPRDDGREWIITLRRGVRWSDGQPLTTDDILFWWKDEVNDTTIARTGPPDWLIWKGKAAEFSKIDDLTFRIRFEQPYALFPEQLAYRSFEMLKSPRHYLVQFHPRLGDKALCQKLLASYKLPSGRALYAFMHADDNPECPRLWPWVYRRFQPTSPQVFVRNPYYYVVDEQGNQLPYIDRVQFTVQDSKMISLSAANGLVSMQARNIRYADYTELMSRQADGGYHVLHWYGASRSIYTIYPNLNRRTDAAQPATKFKADLLADKRFRQALSLALDRQAIIRAEYNGQVKPSQVDPGETSPLHSEKLAKAFIQYDPAEAGRLLESLRADGLLGPRGGDGYYLAPDGSKLTFFLDYCAYSGAGPAEMIVDYWAAVGVRVVPREQQRALFEVRRDYLDYDLQVWSSESDTAALLHPRCYMPFNGGSYWAIGWSRWYSLGGFYGRKEANIEGAFPPPKDHPAYKAMEAYDRAISTSDAAEQQRWFKTMTDIAAENLWTISIGQAPPSLVIVRNHLHNVPADALDGSVYGTPSNAGVETYFFEDPHDTPGAVEDTRSSILAPTLRPSRGGSATSSAGTAVRRVVTWTLSGIVLLLVVMAAVRHPYIGRRLLIMVPTLLIISVVVFTIIQLPPGDFLTARILQLQESGTYVQRDKMLEEYRTLFHYDEPAAKRYLRWMGVYWFASFQPADEGLLQGNLGRSMENSKPVNDIVGDRILLTFLISLGTILLTWTLAIPIGIYSAVRQYSPSDYALTLLGFLGMCVPAFLLALILTAASGMAGLFSPQFAAQPEWDWPKVADLLKHIWIPIVVLGVGGTASMIRVMRANLLDELRKPYVITAMAKGVRPIKLLLKYPVRMALNPFISGLGGLFPQLISGGAIVAMVLSLPTVGPLMLSALFSQDMYLAGSMLMVLSLLSVAGTLVSDLLLLKLDPRIRFQGGSR